MGFDKPVSLSRRSGLRCQSRENSMPKVVYFFALGFLAIAAADSAVTDFPDSLQTIGTITTGRAQEIHTKDIDENDEAVKDFEFSTKTDESSISISTTGTSSSTTRLFSSTTKSPNRRRKSRTRNGGGGKKRNKKEKSPANSRNNRKVSPVTESFREPEAIVFEKNEANNEKVEKISNDPENNFQTHDVTAIDTRRSDSHDDGPKFNDNEVVCSSPPEIEGSIAPILDGTEHPEGTTIWYQCPLGHVSRSSSSLRSTCILNTETGKGEWTHPDISCIPRSCGDPGYVPNGRRIGNLLTFPNKVEFKCEEGFKLRGIKSRYCQAGGEWSGRLPACEQIYCPAPSNPVNGRVVFSSLEHGSELEYKCNEGFMLRNHETRYCTEDGKWSGTDPECVETACEMPEKPLHGSVRLSGELKPGSLALFTCEQGTTLVGTSRNKCLPSGRWTFDSPKCFRFCKVPYIQNGDLGSVEEVRTNRQPYYRFNKIHPDGNVEHNRTIVLRCREGFLPGNHTESETSEVMCIDGTWSMPIQCQEYLCSGEPPPVEHASSVVRNRKHKATVWYKCDDGYEKIKSGNVACMYGKWDGPTPICSDFRCYLNQLSYPGLVKPAWEFVYDKRGFDIQCEEAYKKSSFKRSILCSRGQWDIDRNPCSIKTCEGNPPTPFKGKPKEFTRHHGSMVDYVCNENFEIEGQSSVYCDRGRWVGQPPACIQSALHLKRNATADTSFGHTNEATREPLSGTSLSEQLDDCSCAYHYRQDLVNAYVKGSYVTSGSAVKKGETIAFSCPLNTMDIVWPNGFRMYGPLYLNCTTCQVWHMQDLPRCDHRQQGDVSIIYDRTMKFLPGGIIEVRKLETVKLICNNPYRHPQWKAREGTGIEFFQSTEAFSRNSGSYVAFMIIKKIMEKHSGIYQCAIPPDTYGNVFRPATVHLQIAAPEIRCNDLRTDTDRGRFIIHYQNEKRVNSTAQYECADSSKYLLGENVRKCLADGKWSGTYPRCADILCPQLDEKDITIAYTNEGKINSEAVFTCKSNTQRLIGTDRRTCLPNGQWSGQDPLCEENVETVLEVEGGKVDLPCDTSPPSKDDQVEFVLWYKDGSPRALYSLDSRRGLHQAKHAPGQEIEERAYLDLSTHPSVLKLERLKAEDEGEYRCSVDFKIARTRNSLVRLEIINIRCPLLDEKNITIAYTNETKINSEAVLTCKSNTQRLIGTNRRTCLPNGQWSGPDPSCEDTTCPEFLSYNRLSISYTNGLKVNSIATFTCEPPAKVVGSSSSVCQGDGKWSDPKPSCELMEIHCPKIEEETFTVKYSDNTTRRINSTATLFCKADLKKIEGCNILTCQQNGEWSAELPTCVDYVSCVSFESLPYLEVSYSDGVRVGSFASFHCLEETTLVGTSSTTCGKDGKWMHQSPTCKAAPCNTHVLVNSLPEKVYPDLSEVSSDTVDSSSILHLKCENTAKEQLILTGSSKAVCSHGKWEFGNVQCISGCILKADISPHLIIETEEDHYRFGESILLSCVDSYKLNSDVQVLMCLGSNWSDNFPDCIQETSTSLPEIGKVKRNRSDVQRS